MLVLTRIPKTQTRRTVQDTITIGDDIKITIVQVVGQKVRIGIEAPREMIVLRGELNQSPESSQ